VAAETAWVPEAKEQQQWEHVLGSLQEPDALTMSISIGAAV